MYMLGEDKEKEMSHSWLSKVQSVGNRIFNSMHGTLARIHSDV